VQRPWPSLLLAAFLAAPSLLAETVLMKAKVPNAAIPQGEVRLVRRGGEAVVQTCLQTRFPGRVFAKISGSERENWPGSAEMETYVGTLAEALDHYRQLPAGSMLLIDFVAGPEGNRVDFLFPPAPVWRSLPLSADYVRKNQEHILADSFGKQANEAIAALRTLHANGESHGE